MANTVKHFGSFMGSRDSHSAQELSTIPDVAQNTSPDPVCDILVIVMHPLCTSLTYINPLAIAEHKSPTYTQVAASSAKASP